MSADKEMVWEYLNLFLPGKGELHEIEFDLLLNSESYTQAQKEMVASVLDIVRKKSAFIQRAEEASASDPNNLAENIISDLQEKKPIVAGDMERLESITKRFNDKPETESPGDGWAAWVKFKSLCDSLKIPQMRDFNVSSLEHAAEFTQNSKSIIRKSFTDYLEATIKFMQDGQAMNEAFVELRKHTQAGDGFQPITGLEEAVIKTRASLQSGSNPLNQELLSILEEKVAGMNLAGEAPVAE